MRTLTTSICENCDQVFSLRLSDKNRGRGRFCGKSCAASGVNNSSYKHGQSRRKLMTKEYRTWAGVIKRTTNPNASNAAYYIERGIKVCERWRNSFDNFFADMGPAPSPKHTIERVDNDGDYNPENCKWATRYEQTHNRRPNGTVRPLGS